MLDQDAKQVADKGKEVSHTHAKGKEGTADGMAVTSATDQIEAKGKAVSAYAVRVLSKQLIQRGKAEYPPAPPLEIPAPPQNPPPLQLPHTEQNAAPEMDSGAVSTLPNGGRDVSAGTKQGYLSRRAALDCTAQTAIPPTDNAGRQITGERGAEIPVAAETKERFLPAQSQGLPAGSRTNPAPTGVKEPVLRTAPGMARAKALLEAKQAAHWKAPDGGVEAAPPKPPDTKVPATPSQQPSFPHRSVLPAQENTVQKRNTWITWSKKKITARKKIQPEKIEQTARRPLIRERRFRSKRPDLNAEPVAERRKRITWPEKKNGAAPVGRLHAAVRPSQPPRPRVPAPAAPCQQAVRPMGGAAAQRGKAHAMQKSIRQRFSAEAGGAAAPRRQVKEAVRRVTTAAAKGVKAATSVVAPLLGGLAVPLLLLVGICGVAAVVASPFGLLFSGENQTEDTVPVSSVVGQLRTEFSNHLEELQQGDHDSVEIHGDMADWPEVLAVFAVDTAGRDASDAADVITMDADRVERLTTVFWDMNPTRTEVVEIDHPGPPPWTEYILHIYIESKAPEEMAEAYHFSAAQKAMLAEMLSDYRDMLVTLASDLTITDEDAKAVLEALPEGLDPKRRSAVETALQLVGKVSYYWGGKSYATGWDERWGTLVQVTAEGSSTTGRYLPFGLDCTGYLDWSFRNAGLPSDGHWYIGTNLTETTWADAQPGDIALYPDDSHVGIVVGRSEAGRVLVAHCSASLNTVAVSDAQAFGFTKVGEPNIYG